MDITKDADESTNLIPQLEAEIPKLQKILIDEEKILDEIMENSKGVVSSFSMFLSQYSLGLGCP